MSIPYPDWATYLVVLCKARWRRGVMSPGVVVWMLGVAFPLTRWLLDTSPVEEGGSFAVVMGSAGALLWAVAQLVLAGRRDEAAAAFFVPGATRLSAGEVLLARLVGPAWIEWALGFLGFAYGFIFGARTGDIFALAAYVGGAVGLIAALRINLWATRRKGDEIGVLPMLMAVWGLWALITVSEALWWRFQDWDSFPRAWVFVGGALVIAVRQVGRAAGKLGGRPGVQWSLAAAYSPLLVLCVVVLFYGSGGYEDLALLLCVLAGFLLAALEAGVPAVRGAWLRVEGWVRRLGGRSHRAEGDPGSGGQLALMSAWRWPLLAVQLRIAMRRRTVLELATWGLSLLGPVVIAFMLALFLLLLEGVADGVSAAFFVARIAQLVLLVMGLVSLYTTLSREKASGALRRNLSGALLPWRAALSYLLAPIAGPALSILVMTALIVGVTVASGLPAVGIAYVQLLFLLLWIVASGWVAYDRLRGDEAPNNWAALGYLAFIISVLSHVYMATGVLINESIAPYDIRVQSLAYRWRQDFIDAVVLQNDRYGKFVWNIDVLGGLQWLVGAIVVSALTLGLVLTRRARGEDQGSLAWVSLAAGPPLGAWLALRFSANSTVSLTVAGAAVSAFGLAVWFFHKSVERGEGASAPAGRASAHRAFLAVAGSVAVAMFYIAWQRGPHDALTASVAGLGSLALVTRVAFWGALMLLMRQRAPAYSWVVLGVAYLGIEVSNSTYLIASFLGMDFPEHYPYGTANPQNALTQAWLVHQLEAGMVFRLSAVSAPSLGAMLGAMLEWGDGLSSQQMRQLLIQATVYPTLMWGSLAAGLYGIWRRGARSPSPSGAGSSKLIPS